jgi:hypothetical protein
LTTAVKQGYLFAAELAAHELHGLSLHDALDLVAELGASFGGG